MAKFPLHVIPNGLYCYKRVPVDNWDDEPGIPEFKTEVCPYWQSTQEGQSAYCKLLKEEDSILLWDQVKICGHNEY